MSSTIALATYCVRDEKGSIDVDATVAKFRADVLRHQVERETEQATIGTAVHAVFDEYPGASLNMPYVQSQTLSKLNAQPENFKALGKRVQRFIQENAANERSAGMTFRIAKGKGGGVSRWVDVPLSDKEKAALKAESSDSPASESDSPASE